MREWLLTLDEFRATHLLQITWPLNRFVKRSQNWLEIDCNPLYFGSNNTLNLNLKYSQNLFFLFSFFFFFFFFFFGGGSHALPPPPPLPCLNESSLQISNASSTFRGQRHNNVALVNIVSKICALRRKNQSVGVWASPLSRKDVWRFHDNILQYTLPLGNLVNRKKKLEWFPP